MSQVSQCPSGIVNTTAYIIGMWRDVSSSFGTLFSDAITAYFCDYMQSITVMPRQDSPPGILKRFLQLRPPIVVSLPVLGSRGLGDVVDDTLFESLLFIIPTARRVCSTQDELDCPIRSAWEPLTSVWRKRRPGLTSSQRCLIIL